MVDLTDLANSNRAFEQWAVNREDDGVGQDLRDAFLDDASRFLDEQTDGLTAWQGSTGIPVRKSGGCVEVLLSRVGGNGTEWVKIRSR